MFQSSGNMPVFKNKLNIFFKEFKIVLPAACMSLTEILSIPADLQVFILDIMRYISSSDIRELKINDATTPRRGVNMYDKKKVFWNLMSVTTV